LANAASCWWKQQRLMTVQTTAAITNKINETDKNLQSNHTFSWCRKSSNITLAQKIA